MGSSFNKFKILDKFIQDNTKKFHEALFARFFAEKMIFGEVKQMERPTKLSEDREKEIANKVIAKVVLLQTA